MDEATLISVIMPAYNAARYIGSAIESVLQQTYINWELIIIDDGSTDDTAIIAKTYTAKDKRIKYLFQENGKQAKARNYGIANAAGTFIAFLDADDLWKPVKLAQQITFLQNTNAQIVFADVDVIDEQGKILRNTWNVTDNVYSGDEGLLAFLNDNLAPILTVLVRKDALLSVGGFNESPSMQYVEDYELWLRMLQEDYVFAASSAKLATYRQTVNPKTARKKSIINIVPVVSAVEIKDASMNASRNKALIMWVRRCIQRCRPSVDAKDVKEIIKLFPGNRDRKVFAALSNFLPGKILASLILLYTRKAVYHS